MRFLQHFSVGLAAAAGASSLAVAWIFIIGGFHLGLQVVNSLNWWMVVAFLLVGGFGLAVVKTFAREGRHGRSPVR